MSNLARMRTLDECTKSIKEIDPNTAVTKNYIRTLALSGKIPTVMCGRKRLINLDGLIEFLSYSTNGSETEYKAAAQPNKIRPIY